MRQAGQANADPVASEREVPERGLRAERDPPAGRSVRLGDFADDATVDDGDELRCATRIASSGGDSGAGRDGGQPSQQLCARWSGR
jgi:hypothetical protein